MNTKKYYKKCKVCGLVDSDLSLYVHSHNKLKSGECSLTIKNICYKCKWDSIRENPSGNHKEKIKFIRERKNVPCKDCGILYPYYVMDFDHVKDTKKFGVSNVSGKSLSMIKEEIDKCEVVCSNCHRIRTYDRRINKINIE